MRKVTIIVRKKSQTVAKCDKNFGKNICCNNKKLFEIKKNGRHKSVGRCEIVKM